MKNGQTRNIDARVSRTSSVSASVSGRSTADGSRAAPTAPIGPPRIRVWITSLLWPPVIELRRPVALPRRAVETAAAPYGHTSRPSGRDRHIYV